ncbi:MAG: hypothetical protein GF334_05160 [Candidatus Altiarchaeales archaeon]|nr:hypothetical protein [Candidatus Altiarchaeales archaeon]
MSNKITVTPSEIESETWKRSEETLYTLQKKLYVECSCEHSQHIARVMLQMEVTHPNDSDRAYVSSDDVFFEFNLTEALDPAYDTPFDCYVRQDPWEKMTRPFVRWYRRVKAALDLLRGKPVHFSTDLMLSFDGAQELAHRINEAVTDLENKIDVQAECDHKDPEDHKTTSDGPS